ncbi:hypothetical protein GCM10023193_74340 [Planotetraspora kaengkrachanensis]|uniref:Uncharacterized protein n=1 Tax=Planotetraspora kaengkrachanensis TaxID=575193 RepID=A0A8J3PZY7_9ACTN|nr:hypothetical protein Pka01_73240 [Planotetraspora kaengkrachanensis]
MPPPLSVTSPPPSMTTRALELRTFAVALMAIVTGSGPQEKVITPPAATAATTAFDVQLPGVPVPTTRVGREVSTGLASAGTAARPLGLPAVNGGRRGFTRVRDDRGSRYASGVGAGLWLAPGSGLGPPAATAWVAADGPGFNATQPHTPITRTSVTRRTAPCLSRIGRCYCDTPGPIVTFVR